jgi:hypothetical protein
MLDNARRRIRLTGDCSITTPTERLRSAAIDAASLRAAAADSAPLAARVMAVKRWQSARLAATHADLLAHPRFSHATRFFLEDLYGPKDLSQRDLELARVIPMLVRLLPKAALATIAEAVELDALSERLDLRLARELPALATGANDLGEADYARAYRSAGTRAERVAQIALVLTIGRSLDALVKKPLMSGLLATMAGPARAAGLTVIHGFLQQGFAAFKAMKGAGAFLALIEARETVLLERLFAGDSENLLERGAGEP